MRRILSCALMSLILQVSVSADGQKMEPKRPSCFPLTGEWSIALDSFRSLPEGSWEGNMGGFTSLNLKAKMAEMWFAQLGGSYGLYDWAGRASTPFKNEKVFQQQSFITAGIARAGTQPSKFHAGVSYDWMLNRHFGLFGVNPTISQVRGQIGYLIRGGNEVGAWGTVNTRTAHESAHNISLKFRAIPQANLFWCHYFKNQAYGMLWAGTPYRKGLAYPSGRPGRYIFGARFAAPLTKSLSVSGHGAYMGARSASKGNESRNYAANVTFALNYAFGQCREAANPYLGIGDNSSFLVDTNTNY